MTHPPSFGCNFEYLDAMCDWLRCRVQRVQQEGEPGRPRVPIRRRDRAPVDGQQDWEARERLAEAEIRERLDVHRREPDAPPLGLEVLREKYSLDGNEIIIILAATLASVSSRLAEHVLDTLWTGVGSISVDDLMRILDPCCRPHGIEELLSFRRYFQAGAPLIDAGLITLDLQNDAGPEELLRAWVSVTPKGFKGVTGYEP